MRLSMNNLSCVSVCDQVCARGTAWVTCCTCWIWKMMYIALKVILCGWKILGISIETFMFEAFNFNSLLSLLLGFDHLKVQDGAEVSIHLKPSEKQFNQNR